MSDCWPLAGTEEGKGGLSASLVPAQCGGWGVGGCPGPQSRMCFQSLLQGTLRVRHELGAPASREQVRVCVPTKPVRSARVRKGTEALRGGARAGASLAHMLAHMLAVFL